MSTPTTVAARTADLGTLRAAAKRRIDQGEGWIGHLNQGLMLMGASWQESAQVCSSAVWHARRTGRDVLKDLESCPTPGAEMSALRHRTWWHVYFTALRFDFRCGVMRTVFQALDPPGAEQADPYIRAHDVFAVLGRSQPIGLGMLDGLLAEDAAAQSREVLHVVLQGLWLGHLLPDRAERILQLTGLPPLSRPADPVALMRTAGALRQLGRHRQALAAIDQAIEALPAGDPSVHADLLRERALITAALDLTGLLDLQDVEEAGFTIGADQRYLRPASMPSDEAKRRSAEPAGSLRSGGAGVLVDPAVHLDGEGKDRPKATPATAVRASQIAYAHQTVSLADLISEVTDERLGDLPRLRRFTESAAARAGAQTGPVARDAQHRLEWIARRLYGMEDDLRGVAQMLTCPPTAPKPPR